jgi:hypothetical protein
VFASVLGKSQLGLPQPLPKRDENLSFVP